MRKNTIKQAFRDLRARLKELERGQELSLAERFNQMMAEFAGFLNELKERVSQDFEDRFAEIYFYKFEKPEYEGLKLYHMALYKLLRNKPSGPAEVLRAFFLDELRSVSRFFKQHDFMYGYFRSGFTELDERLFIRGAEVSPALLGSVAICDPAFSTPASELFAQFIAQESLQDYLLGELGGLDGVPARTKKWFEWTGELINLVELGYGIYLSKQVKAGLQEIFNWLEESFGVEIGIPANRFREIKRRKRLSRTQYTELMQNSLIDYMEQDNE